jgi:CBS domain-containing protein
MKSSEFGDSFEDETRIQGAILAEPIGRHLRGSALSVPATATIADAVAMMQKEHIGCVMVVEKDGALIGIFSERDLLNRVVGKGVDVAKALVRDVMTPKPETLGPEDRLAWAMNRMHIGGYRHVPIVGRDGKPIGMISVKDIVDYIVELFPAAVLNLPPDPGHEAGGSESGEG